MRDRLATLSATFAFRSAVAALLVALHVVAFWHAGHDRLQAPFNTAPGQELYYSNPDAPSVVGYPRQPHYWSRLIVSRWDAQHYIGFAVRGLTACPTDASTATDLEYLLCGLGWMPAYGETAGVISDLTGVQPDWVLMAMSMLAAFAINLLWTCATLADRIGRFEAYMTLVAFNLFATAFYVVTPYTEAATFAFMLGGFVCMLQGRWFWSAFLIGASTALRGTAAGFAAGFGCAALVTAFRERRAGNPRWWRPAAMIPIAGWGQVATMVVLQICVGDARAYVRAHSAFAGPENPGLRGWRLLDPWFYVQGFSSQHMDSVIVLGSFAVIALAMRATLRKFQTAESVFLVVATGLMMLLPLAAIEGYWGLNRYFLLCPLTFLCAGTLARKHRGVFVLWLVVNAAFYWHVELCSYIAQGDPRYCPCLGKVEAWFPF